jgi:D-alanyl-lipoteichoic acid acyltransferase DltB (MBOAT superfamily)
VLWGIFHGTLYLAERGFNKLMNIDKILDNTLLNTVRTLKTFILITVGWVFFRSESIEKVNEVLGASINNFSIKDKLNIDPKIWIILILFILSDLLFFNKRAETWFGEKHVAVRWSAYTILIFAVLALGGTENLPFIYFQF